MRFCAFNRAMAGLALGGLLSAPGCSELRRTDLRPLEQAGVSYNAVQELRGLRITNPEVAELVKVKNAGASEQTCVELIRMARGRKLPFTAGEDVARLRRVGMSDETVLELVRLDQLGVWVGEVQLMRLAGINDETILALARRRAQGLPLLSGASLAKLKNAGVGDPTLLELVRRGVADDQTDTIFALRRRGVSESEILRRYPAR